MIQYNLQGWQSAQQHLGQSLKKWTKLNQININVRYALRRLKKVQNWSNLDTKIPVISCKHKFHKKCLEKWV